MWSSAATMEGRSQQVCSSSRSDFSAEGDLMLAKSRIDQALAYVRCLVVTNTDAGWTRVKDQVPLTLPWEKGIVGSLTMPLDVVLSPIVVSSGLIVPKPRFNSRPGATFLLNSTKLHSRRFKDIQRYPYSQNVNTSNSPHMRPGCLGFKTRARSIKYLYPAWVTCVAFGFLVWRGTTAVGPKRTVRSWTCSFASRRSS